MNMECFPSHGTTQTGIMQLDKLDTASRRQKIAKGRAARTEINTKYWEVPENGPNYCKTHWFSGALIKSQSLSKIVQSPNYWLAAVSCLYTKGKKGKRCDMDGMLNIPSPCHASYIRPPPFAIVDWTIVWNDGIGRQCTSDSQVSWDKDGWLRCRTEWVSNVFDLLGDG